MDVSAHIDMRISEVIVLCKFHNVTYKFHNIQQAQGNEAKNWLLKMSTKNLIPNHIMLEKNQFRK